MTNFTLAALAMIVSLSGLSLPPAVKPFLVAAALVIIGSILLQTRAGNRFALHQHNLGAALFALTTPSRSAKDRTQQNLHARNQDRLMF